MILNFNKSSDALCKLCFFFQIIGWRYIDENDSVTLKTDEAMNLIKSQPVVVGHFGVHNFRSGYEFIEPFIC